MKAVILAGGRGTRLAEETDRKPKPLVEIGGMPIIWHIMSIYSHHGINDFVVALGYRGYLLKEYFANLALHQADVTIDLATQSVEFLRSTRPPWRVTLVDTGLETMTGGRLKRLRDFVSDGTFCMTYGDGVSNVDITRSIEQHRASGLLATMTVVRPPARFGTVRIGDGKVSAFFEKHPGSSHTTNGGFFVLEPAVLDRIAGDSTSWEGEPLAQLAADDQLGAYLHDDFWQCMDTIWEKNYLEELWESGAAPWRLWD
jgi:glucose-1-phosphate cytidylyltransferase